jgi:hypothetical protein
LVEEEFGIPPELERSDFFAMKPRENENSGTFVIRVDA